MHATYCAEVEGVGYHIPPNKVTNDDLSQMMDTSDEWIRERTGIQTRYFVNEDVGTSDLGVEAAKDAMEKANVTIDDVDLILAATLSPDYFFPGIGVLIQTKLTSRPIPAMDIRGQCSGFAWGLATADAFLRTGNYKRALVIGAEIQSRMIEFSDRGRNISVLFGDGAGAVVMGRREVEEKPSTQNGVRGVIDSMMGSDGAGAELLAVTRPGAGAGCREFFTESEAQEKAYLPVMNGRQVFRNAVHRMSEACEELMERNQITPEDVSLIVPHQANLRINEMLREKMGLAPDKVFNNIQKYGNTTAATLPIAMREAEVEGRLKKGDLLITVAFGAGFTWGANLIRW